MVHATRFPPALQIMALALAPAVGLGVTRFAYALLLPDMRQDLGWTYAAAGWLNTTNAVGYLAGALAATRLIERFGTKSIAFCGIGICLQSLLICALTGEMLALNAARFIGGVGGGLGYIGAAVIATQLASRHPRREAVLLALLYTGPGIGIVLSGISVPFVISSLGPGSWPIGWSLLLAICLPLWLALPYGFRGTSSGRSAGHVQLETRPMLPMLIGYGLFGAGYIAYMTFMIAYVRDGGGGALQQAIFWVVIGVSAMLSPIVWSSTIRQAAGGGAFAIIGLATTVGASFPLLSTSWPVLLASAALFGSAFFAVVASTTSFVRRNHPQEQWSGAIALMTVAFGLGQIVGPVLSGYVTDLHDSLASGLLLSSALLMAGALTGLKQRSLPPASEGRLCDAPT